MQTNISHTMLHSYDFVEKLIHFMTHDNLCADNFNLFNFRIIYKLSF